MYESYMISFDAIWYDSNDMWQNIWVLMSCALITHDFTWPKWPGSSGEAQHDPIHRKTSQLSINFLKIRMTRPDTAWKRKPKELNMIRTLNRHGYMDWLISSATAVWCPLPWLRVTVALEQLDLGWTMQLRPTCWLVHQFQHACWQNPGTFFVRITPMHMQVATTLVSNWNAIVHFVP